jgi:nicotinate-nucleotide adenylyltransferase
MKIGVLGGSFDPPHKGHSIIANRLLKLRRFDQVWLTPCYQHPFSKNLSAPGKRLEMTKCLENDKVKVSDLEIKNKTISFTIDTLRFLSKNNPQDTFSWIIGTDQVEDLMRWKNWKEIINNYKLIVVPRAGYRKAETELKNISRRVANPENIILLDKKKFPPIYISSTLARWRIKEGKSLKSMLPKRVGSYIMQNNLFK